MMKPLVIEQALDCTPDHAFRTWTSSGIAWWPTGHSVSADPDLTVVWEGCVGGRIYESTPDGTEHDWGEMIVWEPPHRLVYHWHIASDRSDATEVEVTFRAADGGTTMRIEHRGWERLGSTGAARRASNHQGWASVLPLFETAVRRASDADLPS